MRNLLLWILVYTLLLASSQIILKSGAAQIGGFSLKSLGDIFPLAFTVIKNPLVVLGTLLMAFSFFLWVYILSWFKLSVAFPLTALTYVFVALMSYFFLGDRLSLYNYFGITLIAGGIFFLLYK